MVVTADCTLRRITNWAEKLPHERSDTQRRVAARNAQRLAGCRDLEAQGLLPDGHGLAEAEGAVMAGQAAEADDAPLARDELR
jgi:hypothetical protein